MRHTLSTVTVLSTLALGWTSRHLGHTRPSDSTSPAASRWRPTATAHAPDHSAPEPSTVAALEREVAALREQLAALPARLLEAARASQMPPPLLTVKDVGRTLSVSPRTVETLIADGEIVPLWVRGQRRFHPDAVLAYVDSCTERRDV